GGRGGGHEERVARDVPERLGLALREQGPACLAVVSLRGGRRDGVHTPIAYTLAWAPSRLTCAFFVYTKGRMATTVTKTPRPKAARSKPAPKRRKAVRKEGNIHIRVTDDQKALLTEAAEKAGTGVSTWVLIVALREARNLTGRQE